MTDGRRMVAATLGRIYPYRAAKQQAPGVAATDAGEIPEQAGNDGLAGNDGRAGNDVGLFLEPAFKAGESKDGKAGY